MKSHQKRQDAARDAWEFGELKPYMLTRWMDYRGVDGPDVDHHCGVQEPIVDRWEDGTVYPTWEQLLALAEFCQIPVYYFTEPMAVDEGRVFICSRGRKPLAEPAAITAYTHEALATAKITPWTRKDAAEQGRLL